MPCLFPTLDALVCISYVSHLPILWSSSSSSFSSCASLVIQTGFPVRAPSVIMLISVVA